MKQPLTLPIDPSAPLGIGFEDLLCWLRVKLATAESSLKAHIQSEAAWREGDDESWKAAAEMHPSTAGKAMNKTQRLEAADREKRIVVKCRREVEMFKATIKAISQHNDPN